MNAKQGSRGYSNEQTKIGPQGSTGEGSGYQGRRTQEKERQAEEEKEMKVKELIEKLKSVDQNADVIIRILGDDGYTSSWLRKFQSIEKMKTL